MGLDISKITNEDLKAKAAQYDVNNDGKLSDAEIQQAGGMSVFDGINEEAIIEDTFQSTGITDPRGRRIEVLDTLADYIRKDGITDNLMNTLGEKFNNPDYSIDLESVKSFLDTIKAEGYATKADIDKLEAKRNQLQAQVEKGNVVAEKYQKVYDAVIEVAKNDVITKEYNTIKDVYFEIAGKEVEVRQMDNKNASNRVNVTDILAQTKEWLKKTTTSDGKVLWETSYYKEAFKKFEKAVKNGTAFDVKEDMAKDVKSETGKKVRKTAKEEHTEDVGKDPVYNRALRTKDNKKFSQGIARHNKFVRTAKELETASVDTLKDALGEDLLRKLDLSFLPAHKNADGTFDVSALSGALLRTVGYDIMMNRTEDEHTSEMFHARNAIAKLLGVRADEISEGDVRKIMDLCAVEMEPKERQLLKWKDLAEDLVIGGASGAMGALGASAVVNITQNVEITMASQMAKDITDQLALAGIEFTTETTASGDITVKILQSVFADFRVIDTLEGLAKGFGIGLLTHLVLNTIFGEDRKSETSCISLTDEGRNYKSFEKFKEFVKTKYPEKAEGVIMLAGMFANGDEFNANGFYDYLNLIAGQGSHLNCLEGQIAMFRAPKPERPAPTSDPESIVAEVTHETPEVEKTVETPYDNTYIHHRKYGDSWKGIVEAYYPGLAEKYGMYGKNGAIKMLQRALCTDENGVFDSKKFYQLINCNNLPAEMLMPSKVGEFDRVRGEVIPVKHHPSSGPLRSMDRVGHEEKGVETTTIKVNGETVYKATDRQDGTSATGTSRDGAVSALEGQTGKKYDEIIDK